MQSMGQEIVGFIVAIALIILGSALIIALLGALQK
jgi:hypothetical protein